jgi:ParB family chromosome partitioning protein
MASRSLHADAPGVEDGAACRRIEARHVSWARQLPEAPEALWRFIVELDTDSRLAVFAHCAGLSVDAVQGWQRRPHALVHADALASCVSLDMTVDWSATAASYLARVTKARILEAVTEAAGAEAASAISGLKKPEMVAAAEPLIVGTGWLPPLLRTAAVEPLPIAQAAE